MKKGPTKKVSDVDQGEEIASLQDFCEVGCANRLLIRDQQIERQEKALVRLSILVEALADIVASSHPEIFQRKLNELQARILKQYTGELTDEAGGPTRRIDIN